MRQYTYIHIHSLCSNGKRYIYHALLILLFNDVKYVAVDHFVIVYLIVFTIIQKSYKYAAGKIFIKLNKIRWLTSYR